MPDLLRCPHCAGALTRRDAVWGCAAGHRFDEARQGYVSLLSGPPAHAGDSAAMLDARERVLAAGHLDVVTDGLVAALAPAVPAGALVEVGAGTAHHLDHVGRALGDRAGVALDVSAAASRRAARRAPGRIQAVRADAWQPWPVRDGVVAAVLSVFGPRNPAETARVLVPGGWLVVATPAPDHLAELVEPLGLLGIERGKQERLHRGVRDHLAHVDTRQVRARRRLDHAAAVAVATMGPSGHHLDPDALQDGVAALPDTVEVTIAVDITRFRVPER